MGHTVKDKARLIARVRRLRGQIDALERSLEEQQDCAATLQLIAAARGAITSLMAEVLEGHVRSHVFDPEKDPDSPRAKATLELLEVMRTYLR